MGRGKLSHFIDTLNVLLKTVFMPKIVYNFFYILDFLFILSFIHFILLKFSWKAHYSLSRVQYKLSQQHLWHNVDNHKRIK